MTDIKPAEVFHPGQYITDEMNARGGMGTWATVAHRAGLGVRTVRRICQFTQDVTPRIARGLEQGLGIDAKIWLRMQAVYDAHDSVPTWVCGCAKVHRGTIPKPSQQQRCTSCNRVMTYIGKQA